MPQWMLWKTDFKITRMCARAAWPTLRTMNWKALAASFTRKWNATKNAHIRHENSEQHEKIQCHHSERHVRPRSCDHKQWQRGMRLKRTFNSKNYIIIILQNEMTMNLAKIWLSIFSLPKWFACLCPISSTAGLNAIRQRGDLDAYLAGFATLIMCSESKFDFNLTTSAYRLLQTASAARPWRVLDRNMPPSQYHRPETALTKARG